MAIEKDKFIEELKEMSVLELNELVKAVEEEFGVSAAAPVAVAGAAGGEEQADEGGVKNVVLKEAGATKMAVIKALRGINSDLGLKDAKELADNGGVVKEGVEASEAEEIKGKLEEAGATVELA